MFIHFAFLEQSCKVFQQLEGNIKEVYQALMQVRACTVAATATMLRFCFSIETQSLWRRSEVDEEETSHCGTRTWLVSFSYSNQHPHPQYRWWSMFRLTTPKELPSKGECCFFSFRFFSADYLTDSCVCLQFLLNQLLVPTRWDGASAMEKTFLHRKSRSHAREEGAKLRCWEASFS